jgi:hypothetical protein
MIINPKYIVSMEITPEKPINDKNLTIKLAEDDSMSDIIIENIGFDINHIGYINKYKELIPFEGVFLISENSENSWYYSAKLYIHLTNNTHVIHINHRVISIDDLEGALASVIKGYTQANAPITVKTLNEYINNFFKLKV